MHFLLLSVTQQTENQKLPGQNKPHQQLNNDCPLTEKWKIGLKIYIMWLQE